VICRPAARQRTRDLQRVGRSGCLGYLGCLDHGAVDQGIDGELLRFGLLSDWYAGPRIAKTVSTA